MNNELIPIFETKNGHAVSARRLHLVLGVQSIFANWCARMFEYGFVEGIDYAEVFSQNGKNPKGGRPSVDYALTIDCAKEIAMLQRTEKGKEVRLYFIEAEKQWREQQPKVALPQSRLDIMQLAIDHLREHENRLATVEQTQTQLLEKVVKVEAKQMDINTDYYALAGYYHLQEKRFDLSNAQAQQTGKRLTAKSAELGYEVKRTYSDRYGYVNSYHKFILQAVLGF